MADVTVNGLEVIGGADNIGTDERPLSEHEQHAHEVIRRLNLGQPKAALAAAVDLVNGIAAEHSLNGYAEL